MILGGEWERERNRGESERKEGGCGYQRTFFFLFLAKNSQEKKRKQFGSKNKTSN